MQKIDPMFWKKDPDTGQLTEMTRPEKLKRLEYIDLNGDGDGMPELLVLALVLGLGYLCYTYYSPEWLVWIRGWF